jgi:copper chaperone CopZ
VKSAAVDLEKKEARVKVAPRVLDVGALRNKVVEIGYQVL